MIQASLALTEAKLAHTLMKGGAHNGTIVLTVG
jgi:hypothetical protein